jgi:hypothetical protein
MTEIPDPFGATDTDEDPFATEDDVKGGSFTPAPKIPDLEGRLVVMVPRAFVDDAPKAKEYQKDASDTTQDRYTADVIVLDGGPLTFEYPGQADDKGNRPTLTSTVEDLPALFPGRWIFEQAIIGQLKKVDGSARPMLLGVVRRGPQSKDRAAGKTFQDIAAAHEAWRKNPKGNAPRFSWQIDVAVTPGQKAAALTWWRTATAGGYSITK